MFLDLPEIMLGIPLAELISSGQASLYYPFRGRRAKIIVFGHAGTNLEIYKTEDVEFRRGDRIVSRDRVAWRDFRLSHGLIQRPRPTLRKQIAEILELLRDQEFLSGKNSAILQIYARLIQFNPTPHVTLTILEDMIILRKSGIANEIDNAFLNVEALLSCQTNEDLIKFFWSLARLQEAELLRDSIAPMYEGDPTVLENIYLPPTIAGLLSEAERVREQEHE